MFDGYLGTRTDRVEDGEHGYSYIEATVDVLAIKRQADYQRSDQGVQKHIDQVSQPLWQSWIEFEYSGHHRYIKQN